MISLVRVLLKDVSATTTVILWYDTQQEVALEEATEQIFTLLIGKHPPTPAWSHITQIFTSHKLCPAQQQPTADISSGVLLCPHSSLDSNSYLTALHV